MIRMDARLEKTALVLAIMVILSVYVSANIEEAYTQTTGGKIDLFTQKHPLDGKGPNMPSDAFGPGDNVMIFALVTYNDFPVSSALVDFEVRGPENPIQNITVSRVVATNDLGLASIEVGVGLVSEISFGEWIVKGKSKIAEGVAPQDTLSFKVGWIVDVVSIRTLNENHEEQIEFTMGSLMVIEVTLESIALTEKNVTFTITVLNQLNGLIHFAEIGNLILPANGILVYQYFLRIPEDALIGEAIVYICAYTSAPDLGGIPYCPEASKEFVIASHDVAVLSVHPSSMSIFKGEIIDVDVAVKNEGWEIESFNVNLYRNETLIDSLSILDLQPHSNTTIAFAWNTSQVDRGFYRISAHIDPVPGEVDISDNTLVDGLVEVKELTHNVALVDIRPSAETAYIGQIFEVNVTVGNEGGFVESFDVVLYYDSNVVGAITVDSLAPNDIETLTFNWDTGRVAEGNYILSALAIPVDGETELDDNVMEDGVVEVKMGPKGWFVPCWLWWLVPLLVSVLILLAILLHRRKKRKEAEETFYSGWTAWYYRYGLKGTNS